MGTCCVSTIPEADLWCVLQVLMMTLQQPAPQLQSTGEKQFSKVTKFAAQMLAST